MLIVLSPAKNLDYESPIKTRQSSQPDFLPQAQVLVDELKQLAPQDISSLMGISDKLGSLNYDRFQQWQQPFTADNARPAMLAFNGDVYGGLDASSFNAAELRFAQKHLRILSGLYGLLRPLDLMQPYRLEMGSRFANSGGKDLYAFWGEQITDALNVQLNKVKSPFLLNLASNEYFKSVKAKQLDADIITPVFKDLKGDKYRVISFFAKKARGQMAGWIIRQGIKDLASLKRFKEGGYRFNKGLSNERELVFTRDEPA